MGEQDFLQLLDNYSVNVDVIRKNMSFLEIIDHPNHENYLSRMVAYCLASDMEFVARLILFLNPRDSKSAKNLNPISVKCEQFMNGKRADIFAQYTSEGGRVNITIENKNESYEHKTFEYDDNVEYQTDTYYQWVNSKFPGIQNYYIYLKPNANDSRPHNDNFTIVLYSQLPANK